MSVASGVTSSNTACTGIPTRRDIMDGTMFIIANWGAKEQCRPDDPVQGQDRRTMDHPGQHF
ncbi:MAG: hypothetical protein M3N26_09055 [Pseudomonadota bacterium]|nr:hypothetical protein [Pseudomonadota bacterium]